jgi:hypothetical protein
VILGSRALFVRKIFLVRPTAQWFTHEISHAGASIRESGSERSRAPVAENRGRRTKATAFAWLPAREGRTQQHIQAARRPNRAGSEPTERVGGVRHVEIDILEPDVELQVRIGIFLG